MLELQKNKSKLKWRTLRNITTIGRNLLVARMLPAVVRSFHTLDRVMPTGLGVMKLPKPNGV